jgi:hypothetical protein
MMKDMRLMFNWFNDEGCGADIKAPRQEEPSMQDFGTWLRDTSQEVIIY